MKNRKYFGVQDGKHFIKIVCKNFAKILRNFGDDNKVFFLILTILLKNF